MAEDEATAVNGEGEHQGDDHYDLGSLLGGEDRDYLVRNNGDKVKISELKGKMVGLYFSGSWCGPCRRFTPILVEAYTELAARNSNFEIVFVSADSDDEDFDEYFTHMPWLAIPFSDEEKREWLSENFGLEGIPTLIIIDQNGRLLTVEAVEFVRDYGAEVYPFTPERVGKLKKEEEAAKLVQTLKKLLVTSSRDYLVTSNFKKVPISELEGNVIGLYFTLSSFEGCAGFTRRLVNVYNELKGRGEKFEVVLVSLEEDEPSFMDDFEDMPWLGIPFKDKLCEKLVRYFELEDLPTLVVIGTDGSTVNRNAAEFIEDYGADAFPFSSKKLRELRKKEKERIESQTLESLLISGEKDFVINNSGTKVRVSDLVGKNILLYFSAHWCPPCRAFLPTLTEVYNHIKEKDGAFEIILVSSDEDEESFDDYFSHMPWLALPFWDERKRFLTRVFKIYGIPACVAISPAGKTVTKEARNLITEYGADSYPFTKERITQLKAEKEEKAKQWPEKIKHKLHGHVLWKSRRVAYICEGCKKYWRDWSFYCKRCDFDLHPDCALDVDHLEVGVDKDDDEESKLPEKIKHMLHRHVLVKAWRHYQCDACGQVLHGWSYFCEECDFDLHPDCALGKKEAYKEINDSDDDDYDDDSEEEDDDDDEDDENEEDDDSDEDEDDNEGDEKNGYGITADRDNIELGNGDHEKGVIDGHDESLRSGQLENFEIFKNDDDDDDDDDDEHSDHDDENSSKENVNENKGQVHERDIATRSKENASEDHKEVTIQEVKDENEVEERENSQEKDENEDEEKEKSQEKDENEDEEKEKSQEKDENEEEKAHNQEERDKNEDENDNNDEDEDYNEDDDYNEDEDDEDGPGMKDYVCDTRDRESSMSFQESLFTCKLYK
ncbi:putative nucleoredoxin 1 [Apostasia shenzhenica]|uniref:protein-disulfide reductase n=1 Tax=Apostasia shenzhenica TaxID=1088818 RepID=A0A2I0AEU1_9ASPA|nr:putative nucleoredoxin 1 [Apostasia shenzhenica]